MYQFEGITIHEGGSCSEEETTIDDTTNTESKGQLERWSGKRGRIRA